MSRVVNLKAVCLKKLTLILDLKALSCVNSCHRIVKDDMSDVRNVSSPSQSLKESWQESLSLTAAVA